MSEKLFMSDAMMTDKPEVNMLLLSLGYTTANSHKNWKKLQWNSLMASLNEHADDW